MNVFEKLVYHGTIVQREKNNLARLQSFPYIMTFKKVEYLTSGALKDVLCDLCGNHRTSHLCFHERSEARKLFISVEWPFVFFVEAMNLNKELVVLCIVPLKSQILLLHQRFH